MTCFLCGGEITRDVSNTKIAKKGAFKNASERTIWIASVDAMQHTRAGSAEGKAETMVGAKEIAILNKKKRNTQKKHAAEAAAKLTAPFFQITSNRNIRSSRRMMTTTVAVGGTTRMACCWGRGIGHRWDGGHQAGRRMGWERPTWCMSAGWSLVSKIPVCLKVL